MGGDGYSVEADWESIFHDPHTTARFTLMNKKIAAEINTLVTGYPTTDVPTAYTNTAKAISDDMMATFATFIKEYGMEAPPEFIHYKLPHFTPKHERFINIMRRANKVGKIVF